MLRGVLGISTSANCSTQWADGRAQTTAGLRGLLEDTFVDFWIGGTGLPAYELRAATARRVGQGFQVSARVTNAGDGGVAAPVVIQTEEGARHTVAVSVATGETLELTYSVLTRRYRRRWTRTESCCRGSGTGRGARYICGGGGSFEAYDGRISWSGRRHDLRRRGNRQRRDRRRRGRFQHPSMTGYQEMLTTPPMPASS